MEIKITDNLKMECDIPILLVQQFRFEWEPNRHAFFSLEGYVDRNAVYRLEELYDSKIKLWQEIDGEIQILFFGYLTEIKTRNVGETREIRLHAMSGSFLLDQREESASFQNVESTYAEVVRQVTEAAGGRVICTRGADTGIGKPLIRYEESVWKFCTRLADHVGSCVIPDIGTGELNFWFGMRKGEKIVSLDETEYAVDIRKNVYGATESVYEVSSREFRKIGDQAEFCGRTLLIDKVSASFEKGELIFKYLLKASGSIRSMYRRDFTGLGLKGTVLETKQEQIRIALDIDSGNSTGDFFYEWYPETGSGLYAMPEIGSRVLLYFGDRDGREAYVIHCLPNALDYERHYQSRYLQTREGNRIHLYGDSIGFSNGGGNSLSVGDGSVSARSAGKINISAQDGIKMNASSIMISTPDELDICQG